MSGVKERVKHIRKQFGYGLQIVLVGALTGTFAGVVVTLYTVLAAMAEEFSRGYYARVRRVATVSHFLSKRCDIHHSMPFIIYL